jgi:lipoyl-dependent peroxiredoxin subunit C
MKKYNNNKIKGIINMITIGDKFPDFKKSATVSIEYGKEFKEISLNEILETKKWLVIFWYPKDFTFVCPTEIAEFNNEYKSFCDRGAYLLGASTDTEFVHLAWRNNHKDLKNLQFPLLADTSKSLAEDLGILEKNEKIAYRATFIVDPEGIVRYVSVNDLSVGRNVKEIIRTLDALQSGGLTPCNWEKGQDTIKV